MNTLEGWALVFHILGIVLWMGGLLISTHLLAALADTSSEEARQALGRLLGKLFNSIAHPGAILTILAGMLLFSENPQYYLEATWMHVKLLLVAILVGLDVATYVVFRAERGGRKKAGRGALMALHGLTALVFLGVLIMVIIKPFGG
jgi:putative membrane protein